MGWVFGLVDIVEFVEQVCVEFEVKLCEVGGELYIGELFIVQGNCELLYYIFFNLLGNVFKFCYLDCLLCVDVWVGWVVGQDEVGNGWQFVVCDNGIGIELEYYQKIFEVFQCLYGVGEYEGSGIGFVVICNVVE